MNPIKFVLLALLLCLLPGCKKKKVIEEEIPQPDPFYYVKTVKDSSQNSANTTEYFYDASGHIIKTTTSQGETRTFEWNGTTIIERYSSGLSTNFTLTYSLNNLGLATGLSGNIVGTPVSATFEYDANAYMVKQTTSINNVTSVFTSTIKDGNVSATNNNSGSGNELTNFEYFSDQRNTIGNLNMGYTFAGKQNVNLEKSSTNNGVVTNFAYEFDAKNRVSKKKATTNNVTTFTSYTYY